MELVQIAQVISIFSPMFTRVSICFFLLRIFGNIQKWKRLLYGIMALSIVVGTSAALAQCPRQRYLNSDARIGLGELIAGECI